MAVQKKTAEKIVMISLDELYPFPNHPIKMRDDDTMLATIESVKEYGVLTPIIVRPRTEGGYEIIAGRRRKRACEEAGLSEIPAVIRNLDDNQAVIELVDSDIHREEVLPSERAAAFKMRLEATKRQGARTDLTSRHNVGKSEAADQVGEEANLSGRQIQRYVRLTELSPELMQMVDEKKMAIGPAEQISFLKPEEQQMLVMTMDYEQATPSLSQAQRMKKQSQEGTLTEDSMLAIMCEQKKPELDRITLKGEQLRKYFPKNYTPLQMETTIYRLLEMWSKKQQEKKTK